MNKFYVEELTNISKFIDESPNSEEGVEYELEFMMPAHLVISTIESLGYKQEDWETNGWDHDFWIYYIHKKEGTRLCFSGSWYLGSYKIFKRKMNDGE